MSNTFNVAIVIVALPVMFTVPFWSAFKICLSTIYECSKRGEKVQTHLRKKEALQEMEAICFSVHYLIRNLQSSHKGYKGKRNSHFCWGGKVFFLFSVRGIKA